MTTEEINNFIKDYLLNSKLKSAIMLNGLWGTGKSYYVINQLIPFLKQECKYEIVKVSLYGLKDLSELNKQIYYEARTKALNKKNERIIGGKIIVKGILSGVANFFNIKPNISDNDLNNLYSSINLSNKLLIIEDVERTDINLVKLLGFVNSLVEQDEVKVLLVANEKEILKPIVIKNDKTNKFEMKYSESAEEYLRIKEKTISDTLSFPFNFKSSINSIVTIFNNKLTTRLFSNSDFVDIIEKKLNQCCHYNLRTVIFAIQKTIDIFGHIETNLDNNIYEKIISTIFDICIELKTGKLEENDIDIINKINEIYGNTVYSFCSNYILFQQIDKTNIDKCIKDIILTEEKNKESLNDEDLLVLMSFTRSDDEELKTSMENILKKLQNDKISINTYESLASYLIFVSSFLNINIDKYKELMLKNIDGKNYFSRGYNQTIKQQSLEKENEYIEFINQIQAKIDNKTKQNIQVEMNEYLNSPDKFFDFVNKNENTFLNKRKFFNILDVDLFVSLIEKSKPYDLQTYRYSFSRIYRFGNIDDYYKDDIDNIIKTIEKINLINKNNFSKTKQLVLSWLIEDLKKYLENLGYKE